MVPRRYRVAAAWPEIDGVRTLELQPVDGPAPVFLPGQFNMLYAFGVGEAAISISGTSPGGNMLHTIRAVGAVSTALTRLDPGAMLGVRGPFGTHWPIAAQRGRSVVFVAGGLGLPPLRPAIEQVLADRAAYTGAIIVHGARSPDDILFPSVLHGWSARFDTEVEVTVDHARQGWTGRVGVVTTCLEHALSAAEPAGSSAFVCGPEVMMRFVCRSLLAAGVPADRIWLSMERNMKCAVGLCGHCQFGPEFVCRDGPVFRYDRIAPLLRIEEI